jgi:hypothetical protein
MAFTDTLCLASEFYVPRPLCPLLNYLLCHPYEWEPDLRVLQAVNTLVEDPVSAWPCLRPW